MNLNTEKVTAVVLKEIHIINDTISNCVLLGIDLELLIILELFNRG